MLHHPPGFQPEPQARELQFYAVVERTWTWQQLPWAVTFSASAAGAGWWGIFVRVSVCVTGHWLVGHFSHRRGGQSWIIDGVAAQGYNVRLAGLISMGESWHNNHHAFPGSAKMGLFPGQIDLGWWLIRTFEAVGLATNVKTPDNLPRRPGLRRLGVRTTPRRSFPAATPVQDREIRRDCRPRGR